MKMIKQMMCTSLSLVLLSQGTLASENCADMNIQIQNEQLLKKMESLEIQDLSLTELQAGIAELKNRLTILNQDLDLAEAAHDNRMAVKIRNYGTLGLSALTVYSFLRIRRSMPTDPFVNYPELVVLGVYATAGFLAASQGYVYFTSGELRDLKKQVSTLKLKLIALDEKINARKSQN